MSGLSEQDVETLDGGVRHWEDGGGPLLNSLIPAVEQIVGRHVAAALTEAADAIEAAESFEASFDDGLDEAARIVRSHIPKDAR